MSFDLVLLICICLITTISALGVVVSNSIVRSAMSLLLTLLGISLIYFILGAEFLGATQLVIYVGGTLVLIVFGGMLTSHGPYAVWQPLRFDWMFALAVAFSILATVLIGAMDFSTRSIAVGHTLPGSGVLGLGFLGFGSTPESSSFLLLFELVSIHLLVTLIGSAYLGRAQRRHTEMKHD